MRSNIDKTTGNVYECFSCGARTSTPKHGGCPTCGAELMNLSNSRDL